MKNRTPRNELVDESSPYLLQHANNPVNWKAWKPSVIEKAKDNQQLLLISIGYSTCHWCHVMEKECFENPEVAEIMNTHFINIKIDREERPDLDQIYMNALQLMTGNGGWPLNIVALPDGRPVWGATYVRKEDWIQTLAQLYKLFKNQPETLTEYAGKLEQGIKEMDLIVQNKSDITLSSFDFKSVLSTWSAQFDLELGGTKRTPKFMMPNNLHFLLRYAHQTKSKDLMDYVNTSLIKMAYGGIFDHVNGGFSRYAIDEHWHIPHFEKMLYDNAQLVSLYSDAYLVSKNKLYKEVVYNTLSFVKRELTDVCGGFYSALDADSINTYGILKEGAYYAFTKEELEEWIVEDFPLFADYYNINEYGKWEHDHYILIRNISDEQFCKKHQLEPSELTRKKKVWKKELLNCRSFKARPRLDYKILTCWNALMIKAYTDAYRVFNEKSFLESALGCALFICEKLITKEGKLYRSFTKNKASIDGFLDDYAAIMQAFISLYENTLDNKWLELSKKLATYCVKNFFDSESSMFYFASRASQSLIVKTTEHRDNVIPSSNSTMAKNLYWLGVFFDEKRYTALSEQMLKNIINEIEIYPPGYSNWMDLLLNHTHDFYEVVVMGKNAFDKLLQLNKHYLPNTLKAGSIITDDAPLLKNRFVKSKTLYYICKKGNCKLPTEDITKVVSEIQGK